MTRWILGIALAIVLIGVLQTARLLLDLHLTERPPIAVAPVQPALASGEATQAAQSKQGRSGDDGTVLTSRATAASTIPTTPAPGVVLPLPPLDAPVADILDALEQRARAGDARAACRIASELGRCATLARRRSMDLGRTITSPTPRAVSDEFVEVAARMSLALENDERACAGIPKERTRDSGLWLHRAAAGGHHASMVAFAYGSWLTMDDGFVMHPELVAAYSRDAVAMARATIEAGDLTLANVLGLAHSGHWSGVPLQQLVQADDAAAFALLSAAASVGRPPTAPSNPRSPADPASRALTELEARLGPEQRKLAEVERDRLIAAAAAANARRQPTPDSGRPLQGVSFTVDASDCER